jgi:hypothetical protein
MLMIFAKWRPRDSLIYVEKRSGTHDRSMANSVECLKEQRILVAIVPEAKAGTMPNIRALEAVRAKPT